MLTYYTRGTLFRGSVFMLLVAMLFGSFVVPQRVEAASTYMALMYPTINPDNVKAEIIIQYQIDAQEQAWADNDTFSITLPNSLPDWSAFSGSTYVSVMGFLNDEQNIFSISPGTTKGKYSINGRTLTFNVDAGLWGSGDSSGIPNDYFFQVVVYNPGVPLVADPNGKILFSASASGGTIPHVEYSRKIVIPTNDPPINAAASLSLGENSVVGVAGTATLNLTLPQDLESGSVVMFSPPDNLDISGLLGTPTSGFSGCSSDETYVACLVSTFVPAGATSVAITGLTASSAAVGKSITGVIVLNGVNIIAQDDFGSVTNTIMPPIIIFPIETPTSTPEIVPPIETTTSTTSTIPIETTTSTPPAATSTPEVVVITPAVAAVVETPVGITGGFVTTLGPQFSSGPLNMSNSFSLLPAQNTAQTIDDDLDLVTVDLFNGCIEGRLVKIATSNAVYYCGDDGKRHAFPSVSIYRSWFDNFADVHIISNEDLAELPLGSNVRFRAGTVMIKMQTDPKVYVVTPGGVLHWVTDETTAMTLYGNSWNTQVVDMSDALFGDYGMGEPIRM